MNIIAVDPGTLHTGVVYMNEREIVDVLTLNFKTSIKNDQDALQKRAKNIAQQLMRWMSNKPHDAVVIEGFVGGYTGRQGVYVYQTPYLCGYLHAALNRENIVIQTSKQVLNPKSKGNVALVRDLMATRKCAIPGSELCKNDHLRAAACHGVYYLRGNHA